MSDGENKIEAEPVNGVVEEIQNVEEVQEETTKVEEVEQVKEDSDVRDDHDSDFPSDDGSH